MASRTKQSPIVKADPTIILDGETVEPPAEGILEGEVQDGAGSESDEPKHGFVEFHDRVIEVRAPDIEQIVIIKRLQKVFAEAAGMKEIDADKALRLMDRALKAVTSVTVNREDVEFIEDLWLDGELKLEQTLPLLTASMKALEAANADQINRAERRAAQKKSAPKTGRASLVTS